MQFVTPIPFDEALDKIGLASPIGSTFTSSEWSDVPVELRNQAFFSSRVESARVLQRAQDSITDFLANNREVLPDGQVALKTGSRADFVDQMQEFLAANGIERGEGGLTDITSEARLGLVFNIQTQAAQDYGYWKQGMDTDILDEFPAQRFIRVIDVKEPRQSHEQYQDQVYLKTDPIWARVINADFGVPWGPWGWGCGHDVEDVDRAEAEALGLLRPGEKVKPDKRALTDNLQASTKGLDPDLLDKLKGEFGKKLIIDGDTMRWNSEAVQEAIDAEQPPVRQSPVSDAIDLKVYGQLRNQVSAALTAIDQVHDDGDLPELPLTDSKKSSFGYFQPKATADGIAAERIAVRSSGPWPALTAVHEAGHLLDLEAIGNKGEFATLSGDADMKRVLAAAEKTEALKIIRSRLSLASNSAKVDALYLLKPEEIWARVYAQFITEKSGAPMLVRDLAKMRETMPWRGWSAEDFAPVAAQVEKMFQNLGWL